MTTSSTFKRSLLGAVYAALIVASAPAFAYGDGPAPIRAAQEALNPEDVNRVLIWVQLAGEAATNEAETLLRGHRAGTPPGPVEPTRDVLAEHIREAIAAQAREVTVAVAHRQ